ncbi:hypothetical protein [Peribacillus muralis]|uniref:hypothetical protein n=1 Tax=Peribacillus muralis TaxID=264697 RepID=UPI003D014DBF
MFDFEKYMHAPSLMATAASYILIGTLFAIIYRKQPASPKLWKAILVLMLGMFAFHFTFNLAGEIISIPFLPIGVALLSWLLGRQGNAVRWQRFRRFAWLGFLSNFIIIAFALLAIPLDGIMYPKDVPSTYMMDVKKASLIASHPHSKEGTLNKAKLEKLMGQMTQKKIESESWYNRIREDGDHKEKFPYIMNGTIPAKGSGLKAIIFIEEDGRGILITPNKGRQVYFRIKESIVTGDVGENG